MTSPSTSSSSLSTANNGGRDGDVVVQMASPDAITITQLTSSMEESLKSVEKTDWLLRPSAGMSSCCIFKVPQWLVEVNSQTYHPHIVSIGPYHHGKPDLKMMQQHKWRYLHDLLARTPSTGPTLADYLQLVDFQEEDIRGCYSETLNLSKSELVQMMVLDGLFIIEIFFRVERLSERDPCVDQDDAIFNLNWLLPKLMLDLLRQENQIPFFVLEMLFNKSKPSRKDSDDSSLGKASLKFFNFAVAQRSDEDLKKYFNLKGVHLLDLLRLTYISDIPDPPQETPFESVELIRSVKKLHQAGIKFKKGEATSFKDIRFCNGVLEVPQITVDGFSVHLLLNFVAFEQCYNHCHKHITTFAVFMNCLIGTPADTTFLCDRNIIENYLGSDEEVTHFFTNLGKDAAFNINASYLLQLFKDVNEHCSNVWNVRWAGFMLKYFDTPWSFMSASAVLIALLLTGIQTVLAICASGDSQGNGGGR
ncbi:hypothetical protein D8674_003365 [Pyrus ussuriensis x Pyrus communis]|uniref:Uncharacterized protein n=1 Tax=Pyrus ussuriensis x Pyrus communis TaxID=2448454 RepID=A0A5N5FM49_9ROSA|nr:hypothetical protein D8674_003365 [Pyrus ussuriensis x Pyrus communis]